MGKSIEEEDFVESGAPNTTGAEGDESAKAQVAISEGWPRPVLCLLHSSLAGEYGSVKHKCAQLRTDQETPPNPSFLSTS